MVKHILSLSFQCGCTWEERSAKFCYAMKIINVICSMIYNYFFLKMYYSSVDKKCNRNMLSLNNTCQYFFFGIKNRNKRGMP